MVDEIASLGQALVVISDKLNMRVDQMYQIILTALNNLIEILHKLVP